MKLTIEDDDAVLQDSPTIGKHDPVRARVKEERRADGTARCALCDWSATGPMKEVIDAQLAHRETHAVSHHPDVAKHASQAKRTAAKKMKHVEKMVKAIAAQGGWVEREWLICRRAPATIAAALDAKMLVKRKRDGVWGYAIPPSEQAAEDASPPLSVSVA